MHVNVIFVYMHVCIYTMSSWHKASKVKAEKNKDHLTKNCMYINTACYSFISDTGSLSGESKVDDGCDTCSEKDTNFHADYKSGLSEYPIMKLLECPELNEK